ncbi:chemotaxis protein CheW [Wenzhouxiangella limi]|uniref:Chemotaxis protein CheW n=1 Tax=Wenzhouxiangella limi TaxID=2707351 RepID=A0A845V419_9GAMM|nr:chemotaxis protein CheW [Wenzhouxiangella limi]NDY95936.1 chemotaxis protein CheW [Wenzhouxiangella limi]
MTATEVRCVLVPVTGAELLLPNASVAEVTGYSEPEPISDAPAWMPGMLLWRGWQVPLIHFSVLAGIAEREELNTARICFAKSLIGSERMPYFALLTQAFPRLTTVDRSTLAEIPESERPIGVAGRVMLEESPAIIPDLDRLAHLVAHAAVGTLPLSGKTP